MGSKITLKGLKATVARTVLGKVLPQGVAFQAEALDGEDYRVDITLYEPSSALLVDLGRIVPASALKAALPAEEVPGQLAVEDATAG